MRTSVGRAVGGGSSGVAVARLRAAIGACRVVAVVHVGVDTRISFVGNVGAMRTSGGIASGAWKVNQGSRHGGDGSLLWLPLTASLTLLMRLDMFGEVVDGLGLGWF